MSCLLHFSLQKGKRGAEVSREQMSPFNNIAFTWLIIEKKKSSFRDFVSRIDSFVYTPHLCTSATICVLIWVLGRSQYG